MKEVITIYTDGSCYAKHPERLGGSGAYILWNDKEFFISKGYKNTTIDRREIGAVILALKAIKKDVSCVVTIYIDRQNVVNTLKSKYMIWYQTEQYEGENKDLWIELFKEIRSLRKMKLNVLWIRGHQKVKSPTTLGNNIADILANYKQFNEYETDLNKKEAYYYHENPDCIFIAPLDENFGNETEFIYLIGECEKKNVPELRIVCRENNFGWLMNLYDEDKLDIDLR